MSITLPEFPAFKIEQLAFVVADPHALIVKLNHIFQLEDWIVDKVVAKGRVLGNPSEIENEAELFFNHAMGMELEIIHYLRGASWLDARPGRFDVPELSHIGTHVEDLAGAVRHYSQFFHIAQQVTTIRHTNPYLLTRGRSYNYVVFDSRKQIGFDLKLIQRLER